MPASYSVRFYRGDYEDRQRAANQDGCVVYVEQHFNCSDDPADQKTRALVADNASQRSRELARCYAHAVAAAFGTELGGHDGVMVLSVGDRGIGNIEKTAMPATLLEPLYVSNPRQAAWIRSEEGQDLLAKALVDSLRQCFPEGGLVGFSVGHKYKASSPGDRGAPLVNDTEGGHGGEEADYAEQVLLRAETLLTQP